MKKRGLSCAALLLAVIILITPLAGCGSTVDAEAAPVAAAAAAQIGSLEELSGKKVGVMTGSVNEANAMQYIPDCRLEYFNTVPDMATALSSGRVDAFVEDESTQRFILREYTNLTILTRLCDCSYASVFPKSADGEALCRQMNEFLAGIRDDGTLAEIDRLWFEGDAAEQVVDFSGLTGENGTLTMATCTGVGEPFAYIKDGQFAGYDVDIAARFCREYGYDLEIQDFVFAGLLAAVSAGKCDFGASGITETEERAESVLFSDTTYLSGSVVVVRGTEESAPTEKAQTVAEKFAGRRIGVNTGAIFDRIAAAHIPDCQLEYINATPDIALALDQGKIDGYVLDEPVARLMLAEHTDQYIAEYLQDASYGFVFRQDSEESAALRAQIDEFLNKIKSDGTIDEIDKLWFGSDESLKTVDYDSLTGENGTLELAVSTDIGAPFVYRRGDGYIGYETDIITRFCREYGYALRIYDYNFAGMLAAVSSGKCDLGASCIEINAEREESMDFSVPDYTGGVVLVTRSRQEMSILEQSDPAIFEQLRGYRIGVNTGTLCDVISERLIPNCQIVPFNTNTDLALALETWKIDAYMTDEPVARLLMSKYSDHHIFGVATLDKYGFIFPKDSQKGDLLRTQMNGFLKEIKEDGTLRKIDKLWFGGNESAQTVDMSALTGENGTLSFAVSSGVGAPFCYVSNGEYVGYDVDVAVRFCAAYGYDLKIVDSNFSGMIANVSTGKCDFGASCITITEERAESMDFSESDYDGGVVVVVKGDLIDMNSNSCVPADLAGCRMGVTTGTLSGELAEREIPDVQIAYTNTTADMALALEKGKVDAYMGDEPLIRILLKNYPGHRIYCTVEQADYAFIFQKDHPENDMIREQLNEYLAKIRSDGTLAEIDGIWFGDDASLQTVDMSGLTGENGTLSLAVYSGAGVPFCYVDHGQVVGYDVDIAARFCREYGYGLRLVDSDLSGLFTGVASGKCDFGASCITVTEERKESMNFSDPHYEGGIVIVVKKDADPAAEDAGGGFLNSIRESFERTFLRENRWKLFLSGIGVTLLITVLAAAFGTIIGFLTYLLYRKNHVLPNIIVNVFADLLQKTPVVVILMILYYIIFGNTTLDGVWVSVVGFSLIFACAVMGLLKVAVGAVDSGQMEAALALGYTDTYAFLRVILPQALRHFLPGYQSEIVTLIKGTAIVGYIAVQDLTKISDVIRSRTYEAFFPLIASAIIYFALAWLLTLLVRRIRIGTDPKRRSAKKILKGVRAK